MQEPDPVYISQSELVVALLAELERQCPGVTINQAAFNAIIFAADAIVAAAKTGLSMPNAPHNPR